MCLPDRRDPRVYHDPTGSRTCRVIVLKHLVSRRAYKVSAEDVADHIIRSVLDQPLPSRPRTE
jgi:hypothetical protein